jgi:hypothetical protein
MRAVGEVGMRRTQIACELIQRVPVDENAGRRVEDTVIGVKLLDCRTAAGGVSFAENLLKVSVQQFMNPV